MALLKIEAEGEPCWLCNSDSVDEEQYGPLLKYGKIVMHQFCLLFSYAVEQNGGDEEGILGFLPKDILFCMSKVKSRFCVYCSKSNASIRCAKKSCKKIYHFPCGLENNCLYQFRGRFNSFCSEHRPRQRITMDVLERALTETPMCLICHDEVEISDHYMVLWASCCRYTWYHRECLQKYAFSAGRFLFKCVVCRDKDRFRRLVETHGIFLPKRDASWERVPEAYQELYTYYSRCDAPQCLCPRGRDFSEEVGAWNIVICDLCGSQGIHVRCLDTDPVIWTCETCQNVEPLLRQELNGSRG